MLESSKKTGVSSPSPPSFLRPDRVFVAHVGEERTVVLAIRDSPSTILLSMAVERPARLEATGIGVLAIGVLVVLLCLRWGKGFYLDGELAALMYRAIIPPLCMGVRMSML